MERIAYRAGGKEDIRDWTGAAGGRELQGGALTCGWMLTVMGEIFVLKPGAAGAIGRARWRNSSESIAMMEMFLSSRVARCSAKAERRVI